MRLNASTAHPSHAYAWAHASDDFSTCAIDSGTNEDASVAAIRSWVGVPADWSKKGGTTDRQRNHLAQRYNYLTAGARHVPATGKTVAVEGQRWLLMLLQTPEGAALQLSHHYAATDRR
jgi:hypothetical protein